MKTSNAHTHHPQMFRLFQTETDAQHPDDFDDLVRRATEGDRSALSAIAIALSSSLLKEVRETLGEDLAHEAEEVLQDFFLMLLEGESQLLPVQGRAVPWMCGILRAMARRHRVACERRWGIGDDP